MRRGSFINALKFGAYGITIASALGFSIYSATGGFFKDSINARKISDELELINETDYSVEPFEATELESNSEEYRKEPIELDQDIYDTIRKVVEEEVELAKEIQEPLTVEEETKFPISDELLASGYEFKDINFDELLEKNPDTEAWIKVDGTNIDYPVVYAPDKDRDYYAHVDYNGNNSKYGTIYLCHLDDPRYESLDTPMQELNDVSLICGHRMKDKSMFAHIYNYESQSYYDEHPFGVVYTKDGYAYKVSFFAGFVTPGENNTDIYTNIFTTEEAFNDFVENAISKSTFKSDVEVEYGDKLMVLLTCEYTGGTNSRYALFGVLEKQYTNELQISNNDEKEKSAHRLIR